MFAGAGLAGLFWPGATASLCWATARWLVPAADLGETADGLGWEMSEIREMSEVHALMCAQLYGRHGVSNPAVLTIIAARGGAGGEA